MKELWVLSSLLIILILCSAFFSASETALMSLNRYRVRHMAKSGSSTARLISRLLIRPDRLLSVILIGNTFANISASALATIIAIELWGEKGVAIATLVLTVIILLFGEIAPKTLAALRSESVALWVAWPIQILLKIGYPIAWSFNQLVSFFLRMFRINLEKQMTDALNTDELTTLIRESGHKLSPKNQDMLLGILDLGRADVNDIMIPRHDIVGINLEDEMRVILDQLTHTHFTRLPVYHTHLDHLRGILHVKEILHLLAHKALDKAELIQVLRKPYYIPEHTALNVQLINFQRAKERAGIVVNEYGDIVGLLLLDDILEEVVGQFTTDFSLGTASTISLQADGSYIVDAAISCRQLKRALRWNFSGFHAKTLSGVIIEHLEFIPTTPLCLQLDNFKIEVVQIKDNAIKTVRVQVDSSKI